MRASYRSLRYGHVASPKGEPRATRHTRWLACEATSVTEDGVLSDCIFCKIIARTADALIIHEDDRTISFLVLHPSVPGHTAVVPNEHHADIYSIPEDVLASLIS